MSTADSNSKAKEWKKPTPLVAGVTILGMICFVAALFLAIGNIFGARTVSSPALIEAKAQISEAQDHFRDANGEYTDSLPLIFDELRELGYDDTHEGFVVLRSNGEDWCAVLMDSEEGKKTSSFTTSSLDDKFLAFGTDTPRAAAHCESILAP